MHLPIEAYNPEFVIQLIAAGDKPAIIEYIHKYFYRVFIHHYFYNVEKQEFIKLDLKNIRENFFTAGHKISIRNQHTGKLEHWKIIDYYATYYTKRYTIIEDPMQPVLTDSTINMGYRYSIDVCDENPLTENDRARAAMYHNHVHEVLCSGDRVMSDYVMRWLAYTVMGKKLQTMIWLKGSMGAGKSFISTDFLPRILSTDLCIAVQEPSIFTERFNGLIDGARILMIEELPTNKWEWLIVEKSLRNIISSNYIKIEDKNEKAFITKNKVNLWMNSNEAVMKITDEDRRIVMPQITNYLRPKEYYSNLVQVLQADDMPLVMFRYFKEIHALSPEFQRTHTTIPESEIRNDMIRMGLTSVRLWLKHEVLNHQNLVLPILKLMQRYQEWFKREKIDGRPHDKGSVKQSLATFGISQKATSITLDASVSKGRFYTIDHVELYKLFLEKKWIDEDDKDQYENYVTFEESPFNQIG